MQDNIEVILSNLFASKASCGGAVLLYLSQEEGRRASFCIKRRSSVCLFVSRRGAEGSQSFRR